MNKIFTPWSLNNVELPNRLVRSATWEGMADEQGYVTQPLIDLMSSLAQGGVGLIITGYAFVLPWGRGMPGQTGVHDDACMDGLSRMAETVHRNGGKIAMQIVHAGGHTRLEWIGRRPLGPSARYNDILHLEIGGLSREEVQEIIAAFGKAAARAKQAGFDAVQIHGAHSYLINQFLSPDMNLRTDKYGGSLKNRARFCLEVYDEVRRAVSAEFPGARKLNSDDGVPSGFLLEDGVKVARMLDQRGIDAIEVSGGRAGGGRQYDNSPARTVRTPEEEGYFLNHAREIKQAVSCPVISVGGWRSPDRVEEALKEVDAVAMCRPLIREPHLPKRWREEDLAPATCISCGQCFARALQGGVACGQEEKEKG